METISSTDLGRGLSEILSRVQHRGESFTVVRNGKTIASLSPASPAGEGAAPGGPRGSWRAFAESIRHLPIDPSFADDLAELQRGQEPEASPTWPSS